MPRQRRIRRIKRRRRTKRRRRRRRTRRTRRTKKSPPLEFDDDEIKSTIRSMADFVESKGGKPSAAAFFEEVRALQVTKVFDHKIRLYAVLEALFGSSMDAK